jgi:hypothetical protein
MAMSSPVLGARTTVPTCCAAGLLSVVTYQSYLSYKLKEQTHQN